MITNDVVRNATIARSSRVDCTSNVKCGSTKKYFRSPMAINDNATEATELATRESKTMRIK